MGRGEEWQKEKMTLLRTIHVLVSNKKMEKIEKKIREHRRQKRGQRQQKFK
jgi:hypothetical protein